MDEEVERLVVSVRADVQGFARDVDAMRAGLEGPLAAGAERAGRAIESGLLRAVKTGAFGFEDLRRIAVGVLDEIARSALRSGIGAIGGGSGGSGLLGLAGSLVGGLLGLPGRATGGSVVGGRGYIVGERGPELFVPGSGGQVVPGGGAAGGVREVRVVVNVNGAGGDAPRALARSARQVARAVRGAVGE